MPIRLARAVAKSFALEAETAMTSLDWLPVDDAWRNKLLSMKSSPTPWTTAASLASTRLDFVRTNQLDEVLRRALGGELPVNTGTRSVRLAILASCTTAQLHPAIRVAGLRRNIPITLYETDYGQYWQELTDRQSGLHSFTPTAVLFALDAHHLAAGVHAGLSAAEVDHALQDGLSRIRECWKLAKAEFQCPVIHQTALPVHAALLGNNEHRLPGSKAAFITRLNTALLAATEQDGVDLLALDTWVLRDGIAAWHDRGLWHRAKQEISPAAAPVYGDLVGRIIAARQGRSFKCLVLDLDNTVWGGVVGDDGLEGLILGQGSALGEAFVSFQHYVRELSHRGIILAVCSKNDMANAVEPFEKHPEMVLKRGNIACFVANWSDKPSNLREIASQLNIGLDSLVFADDNPFERALVRQELPMVAVPELGDDPTDYAQILADAGYFEALTVTEEDRERSGQYQGNLQREALRASATDLPAYLHSLSMQLIWRRFDQIGLSRTVQLINKTNQFNLTTRRYEEADVVAVMQDPGCFGLQLRLLDRFGDNGIISVIIGRMQGYDLLIDTWLMSCRVLGRQVEPTTLNVIAAQARSLGAKRLIGEYLPTKKNGMVRDHYEKLGFIVTERDAAGASRAVLDLASFTPAETFIDVREG
jgi:FkbH-like protein